MIARDVGNLHNDRMITVVDLTYSRGHDNKIEVSGTDTQLAKVVVQRTLTVSPNDSTAKSAI